MQSGFLVFIGIAYLYIGFIDLLHTLSFHGMSIFTDYDYYANQLWIGARFVESVTLVAAFGFLDRQKLRSTYLVFAGYAVVTATLVSSVFWWKVFPECFVEGVGQTPFKKGAEYVIIAILAVAALLIYRHRKRFERYVFIRVFVAVACTIVSELAFAYYIHNYGFSNLVGHYFKLFSFYLLYEAIIETGVDQPYRLIFRDLSAEIARRNETEQRRLALIGELRHALAEIKTLKGIVPICMHCKKIRDDAGYWNQLEQYLRDHSDAEFSHGICPECMTKYYTEESSHE
jgi:hypothetical protein